eukprot:TRINITY_DN6496_c0_g1_i12.p1 TRINITY_DN6496_c0_g1~~TRINITY_DN6496_c0_g1_i12.p1  ORF type:complete len:374 (-),score=44.45 TRINITY_DN6496_c0_g1_i12:157-1278(-)
MEENKNDELLLLRESVHRPNPSIKRFSFVYILIAFITTFLMLLQIIFAFQLQSFDGNLIKKFQRLIPSTAYSSTAFKVISKIIYYYTQFYFLNGFFSFLYFIANPLISFKIALVTNLAIYFHTILVLLIYREPRPFWIMPGIKTTKCETAFTGPAYSQFTITLLSIYSVLVLQQYKAIKGSILLSLINGFLVFLNLITLLFNSLNAQYFFYQSLLGAILAIMAAVLADVMDNSLTLLTLKLSFFHKSSKKYKFLLLIVLVLIFSLCMAFTIVVETNTLVAASWVKYYNVRLLTTVGSLFGSRQRNHSRLHSYQKLLHCHRLPYRDDIWFIIFKRASSSAVVEVKLAHANPEGSHLSGPLRRHSRCLRCAAVCP